MKRLATLILLILLTPTIIIRGDALSCKFDRGGCLLSCIAQNCATGYCKENTCVCSRCKSGPFFS
jgi:hypothetical protein